jgi:hypothetical protein
VPDPPPIHQALRRAGPALLAALALAMACLTWRAWPDLLVDSGREAYVAWRLAEGEVLYRDVAYLVGPLSPYVNALWFRALGPSLLALWAANLALLAAILVLLHGLLRAIAGPLAAAAACVVFLCVFAFGHQLPRMSNYNFVSPYAHEMTHGLLLCLITMWLAGRAILRRRPARLPLAGLVLGLVFLTKPEIFAAGAAALAVGATGALWLERPGWRRCGAVLAATVAAILAAPLVAFLLLATAMPAGEAARGVLGGWPLVLGGAAADLPFFRRSIGLDDAPDLLLQMAEWTVWYVVTFAPAAGLALWGAGGRWRRHGLAAGAIAFLVTAGGLLLVNPDLLRRGDMVLAVRPLPVFLLAAAVVLAVTAWRRGPADMSAPLRVLRLMAVTFAGALLLKMALNVRVYHYGFVLAMPATLLVCVLLAGWLPGLIDARGGAGAILRGAALGAMALGVAGSVVTVARTAGRKQSRVGEGADAFRVLPDPRSAATALFLADAAAEPPGTLAVLPEGAMLNVLLRRPNPSGFVDFGPLEVLAFGEEAMLRGLQAHPPDRIALVHKDTSEFGPRFFGRDYGQEIFAWIARHYGNPRGYGDLPLRGDGFGILMLERIRPPAAGP